jgi:transposase
MFASQGHVARQYDSFAHYSAIAGLFPQIHQIAGAEDPLLAKDGQDHGHVRFPYRQLHEQSWRQERHVDYTCTYHGGTNPEVLERLVYGNTANKKSGKLREALTGNLKEHYRQQLEWEREEYDLFEKQTEQCLSQMRKICQEHYEKEIELIKTIPGVSDISAMIIIAETGGDMSFFENSGKITGWAGLRPRNDESAGKYKSTATTKGNKYLRSVLVQVSRAASRIKEGWF